MLVITVKLDLHYKESTCFEMHLLGKHLEYQRVYSSLI